MATSLAALIAATYTITARPDLVAETEQAVKAATLRLHRKDFWPKDLVFTGLQFTNVAYLQSIDLKGAVDPLFRNIKSLRKYDLTTSPGTPGRFFDIITPDEVLDSYYNDRLDVCYLSGGNLEIKSSTQDQYMLMGYYRDPDVSVATFNSWIADDYQDAITFNAAASVATMTGFEESAKTWKALAAEEVQTLMTANVLAQGY